MSFKVVKDLTKENKDAMEKLFGKPETVRHGIVLHRLVYCRKFRRNVERLQKARDRR